ncbi:MAG: bifunctional histidinol-phosphatase/imidazoleglycerol-phosphate dehydratase HisB [Pseudomonadota bacterium]
MTRKVAFIDRDGTLIEEPDDFQVDRLDKVRLVPDVIRALQRISDSGYSLVMISNQDGLGTESFPTADFQPSHDFVVSLFDSQGIRFDEIFVCPHLDSDQCECRKPRTGLVTRYLAQSPIDAATSVVIGDRDTDLEFAERLSIRGLKIGPKLGWTQIADDLCRGERTASVSRKSNETAIAITVDLDGNTDNSVFSTGIGFFDHMLEQIARHADIELSVTCEGDLHIDDHHTVEDTAICIGQALKLALGERRGIERFGFVLPMDETEAHVSLDLCGRTHLEFEGNFPRDSVGGMTTEMVPHFFRSLANSLGATLHLRVDGDNSHHMVEACFKAFGRTLRQAIRISGSDIPSSKGVLD